MKATVLLLAWMASAMAGAAEQGRVWLEAEFVEPVVELRAQARYSMRLFQEVSVTGIDFVPPRVERADVLALAAPRREMLRRGDRRYLVVSQEFAVFPYASGELRVTEAAVSGQVVDPESGKAIRRRFDAGSTTLTVRPLPAAVSSASWLPARALRIDTEWSPRPDEPHVGDSLRLTVRLHAVGVRAAQIPDLKLEADGFRATRLSATRQDGVEGAWNLGTLREDWLVIPQRSGQLQLPRVSAEWWNPLAQGPQRTDSERLQRVVGEARVDLGDRERVADGSAAAAVSASGAAGGEAAGGQKPARVPARSGGAQIIIAAGMVLAALVLMFTVVGVLRRRPPGGLARACRQRDPVAAKSELLRWAASIRPEILTLGKLAELASDHATRAAVRELERACYGVTEGAWDGRSLAGGLPRIARALRVRRQPSR